MKTYYGIQDYQGKDLTFFYTENEDDIQALITMIDADYTKVYRARKAEAYDECSFYEFAQKNLPGTCENEDSTIRSATQLFNYCEEPYDYELHGRVWQRVPKVKPEEYQTGPAQQSQSERGESR